MTTATMDDELFRALRSDGMSEELAAKWAKFFAQRENALKADIAELRAAIPDRAADREAFAAKSDIEILRNKVANTDSAIERIDKRLDLMDKRFERMDKRFERMEEKFSKRFDRLDELTVRADEKVNGLQSLNRHLLGPLLLLLVASMFGLLTKGILWGVAP